MRNAQLTGALVFFCVSVYAVNCWAVEVASVSALENAVDSANAGGDKNIVIRSGVYHLGGVYLRLTSDGVTVSGKTGKREDVVLDGQYVSEEIFQVVASNVTIKDLTLKRAYYHPIHISPVSSDVVGTDINNVHIIDPGQQAIKINQDAAKNHSVNYGKVRNSRIELTSSGRAKVWEINGSCYTGGIDAHHARGWEVTDNVIKDFWCQDDLSEHGVHFWSESRDTLVARNTIINCDRGIGFGLGSSGHLGGIIRNNMIYHDAGHEFSDVGIGLENANQAQVYNNTIFHIHAYPNAIEYRFPGAAGGFIRNNLTNRAIASRDGGSAAVSHNVTSAKSSWFRNYATGDLHLSYAVSGVVNSGTSISGLQLDFDKESRPQGGGIDIGADEWTGGQKSTPTVSSWLPLLLH